MFRKILVADDFESFNLSVERVLSDLKILDATFVNYCDEAFDQIKTSISEKKPFDLLITDLSFDDDDRPQNLESGLELIAAVKEILPELKILVFSIEKKQQIVASLFADYLINGFVSKGRGDAKELKKAINSILQNENYNSAPHKKRAKENAIFELSAVEIEILKLLSIGILQKNIPEYLQKKNLKPCSLSTVEKTLNSLKDLFSANNNEQIIAICKDRGIL